MMAIPTSHLQHQTNHLIVTTSLHHLYLNRNTVSSTVTPKLSAVITNLSPLCLGRKVSHYIFKISPSLVSLVSPQVSPQEPLGQGFIQTLFTVLAK
jgi:hypothetical protein